MVNVSDPQNFDKTIDASLPLKVRESLMRGHRETAIEILVEEQNITKVQAEKLIIAYKADLKERNMLLEIQVIQEKALKDSKQDKDQLWIWGARLLILIVAIALIYVLSLGLSHKN